MPTFEKIPNIREFYGTNTKVSVERALENAEQVLGLVPCRFSVADICADAEFIDAALPFTATFLTTNTEAGSSASDQLRFSAFFNQNGQDENIDLGDGNVVTTTAQLFTHTYTAPLENPYTVEIFDESNGFRVQYSGNPASDKLKILNISRWGTGIKYNGNVPSAFFGCTNLTITATDVPDTSALDSLQNWFLNCEALTEIPNLSQWDLSLITRADRMLEFTSYNVPINLVLPVCTNLVRFNDANSVFNQPVNITLSVPCSLAQSFRNNTALNSPVTINGQISNASSMFQGCSVFNKDVGAFDMSVCTTASSMFTNARRFNNGGNGNINTWQLPNVTTMQSMFQGATDFNQPIGGWVLGSLGNIVLMFQAATSFNQNIGAWDVSTVTNMNQAFLQASSFNNGGSPDIQNWNVSSVTNLSNTFKSTNLNQPLNNWERVGSTLANVTTMKSLFAGTPFNQNIGAWDVSGCLDFSIFGSSVFNNGGSPDIDNWDIRNDGSPVLMVNMFYGSAFNQPIGSWVMTSVTQISGMFAFNSAFNQPIGSWDTSSVTNFGSVFRFASSFDQDISGWSFQSVPSSSSALQAAFDDTALSQANAEALIIKIDADATANTITNVVLGGSGLTIRSTNTAAVNARANLVSNGWTINGFTVV